MRRICRPVQEVIDLLSEKGVVVRQEFGGRHIKLYIGAKLVGIHPMSGKNPEVGRGALNVVSQIKRAARELGIDI